MTDRAQIQGQEVQLNATLVGVFVSVCEHMHVRALTW